MSIIKVNERKIVIRTKYSWIIIIVVLVAAVLSWAAEPVVRDNIDNVLTTLEKWIETRRLISKEKQDWALGKEMLNEQIKLVQREITSLGEKSLKPRKV